MNDSLPYEDTKPIGAADFYFAINATFRFVENKLGTEALRQYWTDLGTNYFAPVATSWKTTGFDGVESYWKNFFAAEPAADVAISKNKDSVVLDIKTCPAIKHLRDHQREIFPGFCQHCYFVSDAIAARANLTIRIEGGNGRCRQTFLARATATLPQNLAAIKEAQ